eukprot:scaffold12865_cov152-Skeletonema_menzelii.AAC.7
MGDDYDNAVNDDVVVLEDDYHSLYTEDDYFANKTDDNTAAYDYRSSWLTDDDNLLEDNYYSTANTFSWFDNLLRNTTVDQMGEGQLVPIEDVNPDNVLATLMFNAIVCVILLGLYEVLRRLIPSVYSQRIVHAQRRRCNTDTTKLESQFASLSQSHASGSAVSAVHIRQQNEELGYSAMDDGNNIIDEDISCMSTAALDDEMRSGCLEELQHSCIKSDSNKKYPWGSLLEWFYPIYSAPWSTFRDLAGLDAYFFLRYIRMCFQITAVSTVWAFIILCPVYATGGGGQTGFYHFSMANILQNDKGRVWVPTFFCYAFTLYCWFCVRKEMIHYVKLRMEFLGGDEEGEMIGGSRQVSEEEEEEDLVTPLATTEPSSPLATRGRSFPWSKGYDAPAAKKQNTSLTVEDEYYENAKDAVPSDNNDGDTTASPLSQRLQVRLTSLNQRRYSLLVEKIPNSLRSNTALFNYFNDIFPGQVHSACIAMNVPDLDNLSARRLRVTRRLEKSLAYYNVTGIRPTHISGRPRFYCLGIESTPVDALCLACCCFYDSCRSGRGRNDDNSFENNFPGFYDELPAKGKLVDSIAYYIKDLAQCNLQMQKLQKEKLRIAQGGGDMRKGSAMEWYTDTLVWAKQNAKIAAEGLREEFEVLLDEDEPANREILARDNTDTYGSFRIDGHKKSKSALVQEDHLGTNGIACDSGDLDTARSCSPCDSSTRRRSKAYRWLRTLLWRGGVDFLAAGLDEVRNSTDVVVDSITCPSMSSTGFVTFKTLTPVTVATSVPLTYNHDPIDVCIAPEPRDLKWKNASIDKDIGATREFVANIFLSLGLLLWSIPLTLIQAWAKVDNVARIPGMEWIATVHNGAYKALINGYLPVVVLLSLICLLPFVFDAIATHYEKRKTFSGVESSIVGRYFYYQLANIYITVTAGALWTSLGAIIDHPQHLLFILGNTLPKLAGYFISLLLTKTLAGLPIVLLRFGALSRMTFLNSCFNRKRLTQRELDEVHRKQPIYYGWEYPTQFLAIIICFTYACITPFILPVGAAYFFFAQIVYKKQSLYVYTPTYDSGGSMFPQAISKTLFALMISQLTFIGYTLIRKGVFQIILLTPLPFLTVFFSSFIDDRYVKPSTKLSLERAVKIDALQKETRNFSDEAYQQPVLTEKTSLPGDGDCDTAVYNLVLNKLQSLHRESSRRESSLPFGESA